MPICIIAPDKASGDYFAKEFEKLKVEFEILYCQIAPRVIVNKLNRDLKVQKDFERAIDLGVNRGFKEFAIACNTLQLWIPKLKIQVRVYTTFEAILSEFPHRFNRPIWLGTTPLCREMKHQDFTTLLTLGEDNLQNLVQEIVWRVKASYGADFDKDFGLVEPENKELLKEKATELVKSLKKLDINKIVLGCTELPIAWESVDEKIRKDIHAINPASVLAEYILSQHA